MNHHIPCSAKQHSRISKLKSIDACRKSIANVCSRFKRAFSVFIRAETFGSLRVKFKKYLPACLAVKDQTEKQYKEAMWGKISYMSKRIKGTVY